jgi:hypothetical protein
MLTKLVGVLIISSLLFFAFLLTERTRANAELNYVKLEVKGKLIQEDAEFAVQTSDTNFPNMKLLVKLERGEDKNRLLDRYLDDLKGKTVVANGFLDCRRVGKEQGVIYLYFSSESQISATKDN